MRRSTYLREIKEIKQTADEMHALLIRYLRKAVYMVDQASSTGRTAPLIRAL
jgi:hypothetical protein